MSSSEVCCSFCGKLHSEAHREGVELIAGPRVFICATCAQRVLDLLPTPCPIQWESPEIHCSFCGKKPKEVIRLVAACELDATKGQSPTICDQCMGLVVDILAERSQPLTLSPACQAMMSSQSVLSHAQPLLPSSEVVDAFFEQPMFGLLPVNRRGAPVHTWTVAEIVSAIVTAAHRVGIAPLDLAIDTYKDRFRVKQGHPSTEEVVDFADGQIKLPRRGEIEAHLETCRSCRVQVDSLKAGMEAAKRPK